MSQRPSAQPPPALFDHDTRGCSLFTPQALVAAVRAERGQADERVPAVCVLDFDGDLTDALVAARTARPCPAWACFHTTLFRVEVDGQVCGLIPRTIGGPYAVLIAEQLAVSGAAVVLGLTSAGGIADELPIPSVVVADAALRDEGTSYHYLPPGERVEARPELANYLVAAAGEVGLPIRRGLVWTTDAPYRETAAAVADRRARGALAVEMQAASLFAFSAARGGPGGVAAQVTNRVGSDGETFDKGPDHSDRRLFEALCRAGWRLVGAAR